MRHAALLAFSLFTIVGCQTLPGPRADLPMDPGPAEAETPMKSTGETFADLLNLSSDSVRFNASSYEVLIDRELTRLAQVHQLPGEDRDPALKALQRGFSDQMVEAKRRWTLGNRDEARALIHSATGFCLSCHSAVGRATHLSSQVGTYLADLGPAERIGFEFAFGRFDQGLNEYFNLLEHPGKTPPERLEQLTLRAMGVAVEHKSDPDLADRIAMKVMAARWAPVHLQLGAERWRASIREWRAQGRLQGTLDQAKVLMALAWNKQTHTPLNRAGLVDALRASAILHRHLESDHEGLNYAEALYLSGLNSEMLAELDPVPLNTAYYSACIHEAPHSKLARRCYLRLEGVEVADLNSLEGSRHEDHKPLQSLRRLAASDETSWMEWGQGRD